MMTFALPYYIFIISGCYLLEVCSFLMRDKKRADPEGRESGGHLGRVERGEIVIRIYCMKKKLFSVKEKDKVI